VDVPERPPSPAAPIVQTRGALLKQVIPEYPLDAIRLGVTGIVMVRAVIDVDGTVLDVDVQGQPHVLLSEAAVAALRQWIFEPLSLDSVPARRRLDAKFEFKRDAPPGR